MKEVTPKALNDMYNLYESSSFNSNQINTPCGKCSSSRQPPQRSTSSTSSLFFFNPWDIMKRQRRSIINYNGMAIHEI
jgi:hypothetical protein